MRRVEDLEIDIHGRKHNKARMISCIILTKNEESRIASLISSFRSWINDIIVVDNGSIDSTVRFARDAGARVIHVSEMDFSRMRNAGASYARGDWLFYVDTDEEVTEKLKQEILLSTKQDIYQAFFLRRRNIYMNHLWPYMDGMIRLIRKDALERWEGRIHETARIKGSVGTLRHPLIHRSHNTLEDMLQQTNDWSEIEADLRFSSNHPPVVSWRLFRVFFTGFFDSYLKQRGWSVGTIGIIESVYQGFSMLITYTKLWEKQHRQLL